MTFPVQMPDHLVDERVYLTLGIMWSKSSSDRSFWYWLNLNFSANSAQVLCARRLKAFSSSGKIKTL
jgi:hypothetical protein